MPVDIVISDSPRARVGALMETPAHERPQERLEREGAGALRDAELLAMLLRTGTAGTDVLSVAHRLLHGAGSLAGLTRLTAEDFQRERGIGRVKALQLETVMEIARRILRQSREDGVVVETPEQVYAFFEDALPALDIEKCWVLCLNSRHRLRRCAELTKGTSESTLISPKEVLRAALLHGAREFIIVHNHPGGDPEPSKADYAATRRVREAAEVVGLSLLDHVILGNRETDRAGLGWFSFRSAGVL
ncbi:MAG: DNA repair protein RadC [Puniceicoccales bacterium]|jgi:DNA repair protein RadC|nr:DNA repair protein RadC [Puniceicoccales bacterium]